MMVPFSGLGMTPHVPRCGIGSHFLPAFLRNRCIGRLLLRIPGYGSIRLRDRVSVENRSGRAARGSRRSRGASRPQKRQQYVLEICHARLSSKQSYDRTEPLIEIPDPGLGAAAVERVMRGHHIRRPPTRPLYAPIPFSSMLTHGIPDGPMSDSRHPAPRHLR